MENLFLKVLISHDPLLNRGHNVILPEFILNELIDENKRLPCFFQFHTLTSITFNAACLQFTAEEDHIEIPYIMASTLGLEDSYSVKINYIDDIMNCKFIKIEPQSEQFFKIPDYVDVLQSELSKYHVLSRNQTFHITYENEVFFLKVLEIEPDFNEVNFAEFNQTGNQQCFCLIDQDVNTDIYDKFAVERYNKLQEESEAERTRKGKTREELNEKT